MIKSVQNSVVASVNQLTDRVWNALPNVSPVVPQVVNDAAAGIQKVSDATTEATVEVTGGAANMVGDAVNYINNGIESAFVKTTNLVTAATDTFNNGIVTLNNVIEAGFETIAPESELQRVAKAFEKRRQKMSEDETIVPAPNQADKTASGVNTQIEQAKVLEKLLNANPPKAKREELGVSTLNKINPIMEQGKNLKKTEGLQKPVTVVTEVAKPTSFLDKLKFFDQKPAKPIIKSNRGQAANGQNVAGNATHVVSITTNVPNVPTAPNVAPTTPVPPPTNVPQVVTTTTAVPASLAVSVAAPSVLQNPARVGKHQRKDKRAKF